MRRMLLLVVLAAVGSTPATAGDDCCVNCLPKLMNAQMVMDLQSVPPKVSDPACTTYVGFNSAYAGSNYWSIGAGGRRWDWDAPVHGDSLQGWWPARHRYECTGGCELSDRERPWWAIDIGNQANYVINQGGAARRTFGVVGVWHVDPGPVITTSIPGTNPIAPAWTPIIGARSAWCGLRAHGDLTVLDPITGNAFNVAAMEHTKDNAKSAGGTDRQYPGYASQWDQMLYRDVSVAPGQSLTLSFRVRTRMSTGFLREPAVRTGWFDKDPLAVVTGNFISSTDAGNNAPIDSFMVYVGRAIEPLAGANNDFIGSDGVARDLYDLRRRWFSEVLDISTAGSSFLELMGLKGNNDLVATPVVIQIPAAQIAAMGTRLRFVFRIKTNRDFDDDGGSLCAYSSNRMGAAQLDDVTISVAGSPVVVSGFESASEIDNNVSVSALNAWKSTGKPPAIYPHVHNLSSLLYEDPCGPPGAPTRLCNLSGNVISTGDHDYSEAAGRAFGTAEQDRVDAIFSPTINLATGPDFFVPNEMGIRAAMFLNFEDFHIAYETYGAVFDLPNQGNAWQFFFQSYPAVQSDGVRCWGEPRAPDFVYYNPARQCIALSDPARLWGLIRTSNSTGFPDSIRIGLRKIQQCWRFGLPAANCSPTDGAYWDNVALAIVGCDTNPAGPISVDIWHWIQDAFPSVIDQPGLPGTAAFFTQPAKILTGVNTAPGTCGVGQRFDEGGDYPIVNAEGANVRVDMVFRILPGPGNYSVPGDLNSGLRKDPSNPAVITPGDNTFWSAYIQNNGLYGTPGGHPPGAHEKRWREFIWNSARCDTAECFPRLFPVHGQGLGCVPRIGKYSATYHEEDPKIGILGILKHRCFLLTPDAHNDYCQCLSGKVTCSSVPAWVTSLPGTGYNGNAFTREDSKIIPDDLLTPGSHVEYYFKRTDMSTGYTADVPDADRVIPQWGEGPSTDAHRWQQFSVLPDAWKSPAFGGLGTACMLYVDWADRRGNERVWDGVADSTGASNPSKYGAGNGWQAPGELPNHTPVNPNNSDWFLSNNAQPGTTWDLYSVKAAESLNASAGTLGSRLAFEPHKLCASWNGPSLEMLEAYYRILFIHTGDISRMILGPFIDRSQDDTQLLRNYLLGATAGSHRAIWIQGEGFVEGVTQDGGAGLTFVTNNLLTTLRAESYYEFSGNPRECIDHRMNPAIFGMPGLFGIRNSCAFSHDVLEAADPGLAASYYEPYGASAPYVASVFKDASAADGYYQSLVDGWDVENQLDRFCVASYGRLWYFYQLFNEVAGKICAIAGTPPQTTEVPQNGDGKLFVDFADVGQNPLRHGSATILLTLARTDRVTVRIYDVSGRLVRTLVAGQAFPAGRVDPALTWDGLDDNGRQVMRGAYFVGVRYENSRYAASRKMIVLR